MLHILSLNDFFCLFFHLSFLLPITDFSNIETKKVNQSLLNALKMRWTKNAIQEGNEILGRCTIIDEKDTELNWKLFIRDEKGMLLY